MVTYAGEEIERDYFARFGDQRGGKEWGTYNFAWFNGVGDWTPIDTDTTGWDEADFEEYRQELEHELVHTMLENPNSNLYQAIENNLTEGYDEHYITSYQVRNEDGDVQKLDFYISWDEPSEVRQKIQYYDKEPLHRLEFLAEKKLPPVEKAIDSGIASGATMEGLDLALGAEGVNDLINEIIEDVFSEFEIWEFSGLWYEKLLKSKPVSGTGIFEKRDCYIEDSHIGKYFYIHKNQSSLTYTDEYEYGEWNYQPTEDTRRKVKAYQEKLRKKYGLPSIELGIDGYGLGDGDSHTPVLVMKVAVGKSKKMAAEDDDPYGAKWEALRKSKRYRDKAAITGKKAYDRFAKIIAEKKLEAEEPSAYEFVKREIIKASPITESEVNRFLDKLANVPMSYLKEARSEALKLQDEMAVGILTMAINRRSFREEWASEDTEELRDNFAQLKAKNPELAREIEFSVKNEGELPEDKIKQAGVDLDMIEAWYDLVASGDDPNLVPYESCATCEGEGIIITNYYPATRFDPADADFIDCEECIEGEYDPAYYMDKEGQYYAETFEAERKDKPIDNPKINKMINEIFDKFERKFRMETEYANLGPLSLIFPFAEGSQSNEAKIGKSASMKRIIFNAGKGQYKYLGTLDTEDYRNYGEYRVLSSKGESQIKAFEKEMRRLYRRDDIHVLCEGIDTSGWDMAISDYNWRVSVFVDEPIPENINTKDYWSETQTFEGEETNGDRQLEESVKRTKMSMIRTGLAITTFGIVLWNLWTNKKQEKQIDDIMDVV